MHKLLENGKNDCEKCILIIMIYHKIKTSICLGHFK